jgi:hypothetical protein
MAWVVDSCVLLDIRMNDADFGLSSANCLAAHLPEGLTIAPMTYVELAPAFRGDEVIQKAFLERSGIEWLTSWTWADTEIAHRLWAEHVERKRIGQGGKRPKHFTTVPVVVP